jgi:hypothetical protein
MKTYAIAIVMLLGLVSGCGSSHRQEERKPEFGVGEGAIAGKLVGGDSTPFDVSLAGGARALRIELLSTGDGIAAATFPKEKPPEFVFSHVKPGRYEMTVYAIVPGKRTIAGSTPVVVNSQQVTPVTLTLVETPISER